MQHARRSQPLKLVAFLLALLAVPMAWSQQALEVHERQGVTFVSGGLGQAERDQLKGMQDRFNLKLVFAIDAGNYLSYIDVRIVDEQGRTLVETKTDGPILMANLPPGTYTVTADNEGSEKERSVSIGGQGMTGATFTWEAG